MDLTPDKGQPFTRATAVSSGFGEPTGRQFHEYQFNRPRAPQFFVFFVFIGYCECSGARLQRGGEQQGCPPCWGGSPQP